jgi:hypothetical protein
VQATLRSAGQHHHYLLSQSHLSHINSPQEIHKKITSIGFQDCKVFIHSVDAQSSANGGIIIQVIGEMSNHGEPWRKFVQTFFLAEQPNGYFVLNDIFRFLKEESIEGDEASSEAESYAPEPAPPPAIPEPAADPVSSYEPEPPTVAEPPSPKPIPLVVDEPAAPAAPEPVTAPLAPVPEPQTNGIHGSEPELTHEPPTTVEPPVHPPSPSPIRVETPQPSAPPPAAPPFQQQDAPQPEARTPVAAPAPKTWANLAAHNSKKWGSAVAQESRGTTEVPVTSGSPAPPSASQAPPGSHGHGSSTRRDGGHHGPKENHPAYVAAQSVSTPQVFVKVRDS